MKKNNSKIHLLPVILAVLLVAALVVIGWLYTRNSTLRDQVTTLEAEVTALNETLAANEDTINGAVAQLNQTQTTLAGVEAELAAAQSALADAEAALELAASVQAEADDQIIALNAALEASNAQLAQLSADKEAADAALAALGYSRIEAPEVVEPVTEEPIAEEPITEEPIEEIPAVEEGISETPAEEYATPIFTVYTADALGLAFEGPVDWVITDDPALQYYILSNTEVTAGCKTSICIMRYWAFEGAQERYDQDLQESGDAYVPTELLGKSAVYKDVDVTRNDGQVVRERKYMVMVDDTLYIVLFEAAPEIFDAEVTLLCEPICESMRLIP